MKDWLRQSFHELRIYVPSSDAKHKTSQQKLITTEVHLHFPTNGVQSGWHWGKVYDWHVVQGPLDGPAYGTI